MLNFKKNIKILMVLEQVTVDLYMLGIHITKNMR